MMLMLFQGHIILLQRQKRLLRRQKQAINRHCVCFWKFKRTPTTVTIFRLQFLIASKCNWNESKHIFHFQWNKKETFNFLTDWVGWGLRKSATSFSFKTMSTSENIMFKNWFELFVFFYCLFSNPCCCPLTWILKLDVDDEVLKVSATGAGARAGAAPTSG